jgi:hypothetical protein
MSEQIDIEQIKQAWDRVARTADGQVIYRHLQRIRMGLAPENVPDSALPRLEGRRSLAADLMAFMSEGIAENDRSCITFAVAKPAAASTGTRGAGRRIGPEHFVPGYDAPGLPEPTFTAPGSTNGSSGGAGST